ncbi:hypothetical protein KP509_02G081900 [Ceratopteris richardii]|uniref:Uncharacterized protein n=1 Tax=Ceratopteris richardii TaxID=49495 RepID=A0A8T2VFM7_CERRI|nr:hypothetical protein KP509_02G081900 [Ceratopteris richardii]
MKAVSALSFMLLIVALLLLTYLHDYGADATRHRDPLCVSRLPYPSCRKSPVDGTYTDICSCCALGDVNYCPCLAKDLAEIKDLCARVLCMPP